MTTLYDALLLNLQERENLLRSILPPGVSYRYDPPSCTWILLKGGDVLAEGSALNREIAISEILGKCLLGNRRRRVVTAPRSTTTVPRDPSEIPEDLRPLEMLDTFWRDT